ncbi:MAG: hypothetical protein AABY22_31890 [Nanoarchaeota archaeon]
MVRISKEKIDTIKSNILAQLYHSFPKQLFTSEISKLEARDEEFIKNLLFELKEKKLVVLIRKNETGKLFVRRMRWQLTPEAYQAYSQKAR